MWESMCEWPNPYPRRATVVALFRVVVKSYPQYGMGRMRSSLPLMDLAMLGFACGVPDPESQNWWWRVFFQPVPYPLAKLAHRLGCGRWGTRQVPCA